MLLGYNTNGMAHHDLFDAVQLLADIGYQSVAITIDHNSLSPDSRYNRQQVERLRSLLLRRLINTALVAPALSRGTGGAGASIFGTAAR